MFLTKMETLVTKKRHLLHFKKKLQIKKMSEMTIWKILLSIITKMGMDRKLATGLRPEDQEELVHKAILLSKV